MDVIPEDKFQIIKIPVSCIPEGGELVEAYKYKNQIIVCGDPPYDEGLSEEENDDAHNCDAMGCGTLSHVLYRFYI